MIAFLRKATTITGLTYKLVLTSMLLYGLAESVRNGNNRRKSKQVQKKPGHANDSLTETELD